MIHPTKAKLELCACEKHGRLLDDLGRRGPVFCSKSTAFFAMKTAVERRYIDLQMTSDMTFDIDGCRLPLDDGDADPSLLEKVMYWNTCLLAGDTNIRHENFHDYFNN